MPYVQGIGKELEISMCQMEKSLFNLTTGEFMNIDEIGGAAFALRARDYKDPQCVAIENHPNDSRVKIREDGTVQTLSSRMGTGGGTYRCA